MDKILRKYTTIPPHLYVKRNADEQLRQIVEDMDRPGYVLVARQMGKTNLLINAKRTLENSERLFVYIDLSNTYKYERECYINIIDTIIETNDDLFLPIENRILELRENKFPAHKEYSSSLRILLEFFKGEIIIILDEIDALRSSEYSDNVFAQIRSNYFSRTNFEEFERLTYILSGVIEPSELIKDRNKSPFNIGEKIYLDDFTIKEHNSFIDKSKLNLDESISKNIFSWTNGNPRLTFDICSEIEDELISKRKVTIDSIKQLIKKKYLTTFDIAPIDHIRELVKSSRKVRNALINLQNDINDIPDELKKQLYLYGIINSQFDKKTKIKNKIIEGSLSISWLQSIQKSSENITITQGLAYYEAKNYHNAIDIFLEIIDDENITPENLDTNLYFLGLSYFHLKDYKNALTYLDRNFINEKDNRLALSFTGICKIAIGKLADGFKDLEEIIKVKSNDTAYQNALYNIAINISEINPERALELFSKLYNSTLPENFILDGRTSDEVRNLSAAALFLQAEIKVASKKNEEALVLLESSLNFADRNNSGFIKYIINEISSNKNENLIFEITDDIISNKLEFNEDNTYPTKFDKNHLFLYLGLLFNKNRIEPFSKLVEYAYKSLFNKETSRYEIIYSSSKRSNSSYEILSYLLSLEPKDKELRKLIYFDLSKLNKDKFDLFFEFFDKYIELVEVINVNDLGLFTNALKLYYDHNLLQNGIDFCLNLIPRIELSNDKKLKLEAVIIYYWLSKLYEKLGDKNNSKKIAENTIELIKRAKKETLSILDEQGLKLVESQMNDIIYPIQYYSPFLTEFKFGRNEIIRVKYPNGIITSGKYKNLEGDIKLKKCLVIKSNN